MSSSITEQTRSEVNIYPNPATDQLFVGQGTSLVELYDINGKTILTEVPNTNSIDIRNVPPGLYFARIIDYEGTRYTTKLVKR